MRWNRSVRAKLAKMVWGRSLEIDEQIRSVCRSLDVYTDERDRRIPAYFEGLGFRRATADEWVYDPSYNHPPLFKARGAFLFVIICNQMVMKIEKEKAENILVLGMP